MRTGVFSNSTSSARYRIASWIIFTFGLHHRVFYHRTAFSWLKFSSLSEFVISYPTYPTGIRTSSGNEFLMVLPLVLDELSTITEIAIFELRKHACFQNN